MREDFFFHLCLYPLHAFFQYSIIDIANREVNPCGKSLFQLYFCKHGVFFIRYL